MKSANQEECVLCCREITIYAAGVCDHPVCYECSARMRVLCETNECPICRSDMPHVVFTHQVHIYSEASRMCSVYNKKYKLLFEDKNIESAFDLLLSNTCTTCKEVFPSFERLKEHVRRKHELHYCDLCTENLKIFNFERKCYNRKDLARHKIKGDPDQTSHRGHPLCEFCDMRYVDQDDLFRHVRREHFFCHFCDADGVYQFYKNYDYLRVHFRTKHYLCEEGDCVNEQFISAFRTEIDLKAHKAYQHSKHKTKAEAKIARTLETNFNLSRQTGSSSPRGRPYAQQKRNNIEVTSSGDRNNSKKEPEAEPLNTDSTQEFPYLSEDALGGSGPGGKPRVDTMSLQYFGRTSTPQFARSQKISAEDFPALIPGSAAATSEVATNHRVKINSGFRQNNAPAAAPQISRPSAFSHEVSRPGPKPAQPIPPKWLTKGDISHFEDAFPKLEVKRAPLSAASSITSKVSNAQNYSHITNNDTPQQNSADQFVVIKSKKKKKPTKVTEFSDEVKEEEFEQNQYSSTFSSDSNQENKNPDKKSSRVPSYETRKLPVFRESDSWEQPVSFRTDDFPPLEVKKKPPPPALNAKKTKVPPPGFRTTPNISNNSSSLSMSSIAQIVGNSLKNNNSEKVNGVTESLENNHSFSEPPDFKLRNDKLISKINDASQTDENFQEFKCISRKFRISTISADEYYSKCLRILGEEGFQDIFPELISLLPDIPKQQELLIIHNRYSTRQGSNAKRKNKLKNKNDDLSSCNFCNQVLLIEDCKNHSCV